MTDETDVKRREKECYDSDGEKRSYGSLWDSDSLESLYEMGAAPEWERLLAEYAASGPVLDVGCGDGRTVERLLDFDDGRTVSGIEISSAQIRKADRHVGRHLLQGDAERLPYADDSFRTVLMSAALHHLPNWADVVMDEINRVLAPDGHFMFWEPGRYNPPAAVGRRFFPSDSHTPDETPFDPRELESVLGEHFETVSIHGYYVFSHVVPVLSKFVPAIDWSPLARLTYRAERCLPFSDRFSWVLVGAAHGPRGKRS